MSALLRDVRLQLIHELGVKMDDALEAARVDSIRKEGAHAAYGNAARNVRMLFTQAEKEHSEGKLSANDYDVARVWIKRCVAVCDNLTSQAMPLMHSAKGAERQTATVVAMLKQMYDLEEVKKQRETVPLPTPPAAETVPVTQDAAPEAEKEEPKRPHARPRTIKEQRLAEAAARKAEEEAAAAAAAAEEAKKAAPKKRGRRARNA